MRNMIKKQLQEYMAFGTMPLLGMSKMWVMFVRVGEFRV